MEIKQVEFQFKGARRYIQGPDLFNAMIDVGAPASLCNIRFLAHRFVESPICELYSSTDKNELNALEDVSARCQFDIGQTTHWRALKPVATEQSGQRAEYDEARLIALCRRDRETIRLEGSSPYTFIETLVSMNKHLHQQMFPEAAGKWIFTRVDLDVVCNARAQLALHFKHNMNFRLTKSDILVDDRKIGDLYFSLITA